MVSEQPEGTADHDTRIGFEVGKLAVVRLQILQALMGLWINTGVALVDSVAGPEGGGSVEPEWLGDASSFIMGLRGVSTGACQYR